MPRSEFITSGDCDPVGQLAPGVDVRVYVSAGLGASELTVGTATIQPKATLPYHTHPTGEAIAVARGQADVYVEGRRYRLRPFDAIYVPESIAHSVQNSDETENAVLHTSFPTGAPERDFVEDSFNVVDCESTNDSTPETLIRFASAEVNELSPGIEFRDLFAGRFGSRGVCGGYGTLSPGSALPCQTRCKDVAMTIVDGQATCQIADREFDLSNFDTICVPSGLAYQLLNRGELPSAILWSYADDESEFEIIDDSDCDV